MLLRGCLFLLLASVSVSVPAGAAAEAPPEPQSGDREALEPAPPAAELGGPSPDSAEEPETAPEPPAAAPQVPAPAPPPPPPPQALEPAAAAPAKTGKLSEFDYTNYDCLRTREAPPTHRLAPGAMAYVVTEARLKQIRAEFLYCFFDQGGDDGFGDYQKDIHTSTPQIHKNLNFQLPFFGFRFNYTRLSLNGYLEFSDPPDHYTYPLAFPVAEWPKKNDPSFMGIFFSKMRIGKIRPEDVDQRRPGVYFRLERDLQTRTDQFGVEMRERLMWDVREGVVGADTFVPKHAVVVTWKNMSFAGGIDNSLYKTNTFQMVLATDEVYTYAIFNYVDIQWSSHTEAGGDTSTGEGGVPAFIGFNAGNGTRSYEYKPYSQDTVLRDLTGRGWGNGFPGRHIFRIDERIMQGTCNKDIAGTNLELMFAPESGNMLGGTVVNITGPCFEEGMKVKCKFDKQDVWGTVVDRNRAICVQPMVFAEGYVPLEIAVGTDSRFNWKGKFFIESPATATERIFFNKDEVHQRSPPEIRISWDRYNLTSNWNAPIRISVWGYREVTVRPEFVYLDTIEESTVNSGSYTIGPGNYRNRDNFPAARDIHFGFLQINLTNAEQYQGLSVTPVLWSRPIPLGWYLGPQWERQRGSRWPHLLCNDWITRDRYLKNFAGDIPQCPCTLEHALNDKGRFLPDFECNRDINSDCVFHQTAVHCVRTGAPSMEGSEQKCCYDKNNYLMLTYDQQWGSRPARSHNLGFLPWNEATKVPSLSQWYHDIVPFYLCCMWQEEQAVGCETFRFERRPTQDCVAYQSPGVATVFGDPHIITFDGLEYTFNGKGEYVLVRADTNKVKLDVQGRFEQVPRNVYGEVAATMLTAVAAQSNNSAVIEVRVRPHAAQWRYRLDVFANGQRVYFDRISLKVQHFPGVTVYTPLHVLNQSEVVMMFESGAGVEVVENKGYLATRVYLPWNFINQTKGLFGNWSFDLIDDLVLPNDFPINLGSSISNFQRIHEDFAQKWMLDDRENKDIGGAKFTREFQRTSNYFSNRTFVPEYHKNLEDIIPYNRSSRGRDIADAKDFCGDSYQCQFDYALTLNREFAHFTKIYQDEYSRINAENEHRTVSCGVLETPRFGRKSNFFFTPGTTVSFECDQDFILIGDSKRTCDSSGQWNIPEYGYSECLRRQEYSSRQAGITAGIIMAVLVPLILIIMFGVYRVLVAKRKSQEGETDPAQFPSGRSSKFGNNPSSAPTVELKGGRIIHAFEDGQEMQTIEKKESDID